MFFTDRVENYSIEEIPFPDLHDCPQEKYLYQGRPLTFVITSRACPFGCTFCSVQAVFGKKYRRRNVEHVMEELRLRYAQGYRVFDFEDDNLSFDKNNFLYLCQQIEQEFQGLDVELMAMNGMGYHFLDGDILLAMKKAGFKNLNLSLVTGNLQLSSQMKRHDLTSSRDC
jgi:radical SAM superfamily enzyme YgiQ (UPF0313 family)